MEDLHYDLCVIGGGINGVAIARDAVGRGLSVLLVEQQDLAGATSSASTKLIHGGLRYLENYEFSMVRKALKEREILYKSAPHLIWPIECVLPHNDKTRPRWMVRLGVWLYDRLGGRKSLDDSKMISFAEHTYGDPLIDELKDGIVYADCWADDTRLVVMNAVDAAARGAKILTYTRCEAMRVDDGKWRLSLRDVRSADSLDIHASMVVNATGPWVRRFLDSVGANKRDPDLPAVRLVKGSHIILNRQYEGGQGYVLQQPDGRIVFVAPYEGTYTLVGTTEEGFDGNPHEAMISDDEMTYLCAAYNRSFKKRIGPSDVIFTFSGVRPLLDDGKDNASKVTRDYKIYHHKRYDPTFLSVYGGKLTTHRFVAEDVVDRLMRLSGRATSSWTAKVSLAGGDLGKAGFIAFCERQLAYYPFLSPALIYRYARAYGTQMDYFLRGAGSLEDLGAHYGDDVYHAEIAYLMNYEWATGFEDIIWRRSKMGIHLSQETLDRLEFTLHPERKAGREVANEAVQALPEGEDVTEEGAPLSSAPSLS